MRLALVLSLFSVCGMAQTPSDPPLLIRLVRSEFRGEPDPQVIAQYRRAQVPITVLGMQSTTGPAESWRIEVHNSFESIEAIDHLMEAPSSLQGEPGNSGLGPEDMVPISGTWIALYRPHLSYRPDEAIRLLPMARYFIATTYRVRSGAEGDFADLVRLRKTSQESINLDRPEIAYQVVSGSTSGTFVFLTPLTSLRVLDEAKGRAPLYTDGYADSARGEKKPVVPGGVSREDLLLRVRPQSSLVPQNFGEADPEFWGYKEGIAHSTTPGNTGK